LIRLLGSGKLLFEVRALEKAWVVGQLPVLCPAMRAWV
jgi:hypothetical protein